MRVERSGEWNTFKSGGLVMPGGPKPSNPYPNHPKPYKPSVQTIISGYIKPYKNIAKLYQTM